MNTIDHKKRDARIVEQMFSGIARRYDLLNHVLSLGLDIRWRKRVARETGQADCSRILDVCTGTGDTALELCRFWKEKAYIEGLDFSRELIGVGKQKIKEAKLDGKISFIEGNAEELPYQDGEFDAVTITFGLRNISNRSKALNEFYRVTKPGGCFVCLEFTQPSNRILLTIYLMYLMKFVPVVSKILGSDPAAYQYLGNTIIDFPKPPELAKLLESAGWKDVTCKRLTGGIVALHKAKKYDGIQNQTIS